MNLGYKLAGVAVGIGLLTLSTACVVEQPYHPVKPADLESKVLKNIIVEGVPESLRKDRSFILKVGQRGFFVELGKNAEATTLGINVGNDEKASSALEKEISDGDQETIRVMGDFMGDKTIQARYLQIENSLYPVYR